MRITCQSTGLLSSTPSVVASRPCLIHSITLLQASAACTAILYDNATTNSGTEVTQLNNNTNTSTVTQAFNTPVECLKGATVALTGSGAKVIIHYSLL